MMSTPFAFDIVESSMRIMVDGDDIRVAFSKDLQREPLSFCDQASRLEGMVALWCYGGRLCMWFCLSAGCGVILGCHSHLVLEEVICMGGLMCVAE